MRERRDFDKLCLGKAGDYLIITFLVFPVLEDDVIILLVTKLLLIFLLLN